MEFDRYVHNKNVEYMKKYDEIEKEKKEALEKVETHCIHRAFLKEEKDKAIAKMKF